METRSLDWQEAPVADRLASTIKETVFKAIREGRLPVDCSAILGIEQIEWVFMVEESWEIGLAFKIAERLGFLVDLDVEIFALERKVPMEALN